MSNSLSVTQLVRKMRNLLEIELGELWIEGEVSNLRKQASGHYYFSLKDSNAQMTCAMFSAKRKLGGATLEDGAKVRVFAEVTVYEARGQAQLVVKKVEGLGFGDLQVRFEKLKRELQAEGLFAADRKRELPYFPQRIGIVTSPTGAALQDMMNVLNRRAPWLKIVLYPTQVQGAGAENGIAAGIASLDKRGDVDVIIIGRGGGSIEDLWNFNEEIVARAVADCATPLISAVGHEIDFTIADFAADVRAPTPSAAAEIVAPSRDEILQRLQGIEEAIRRRTVGKIERLQERVKLIVGSTLQRAPQRILQERQQTIDRLSDDLTDFAHQQLAQHSSELENSTVRLSAHRPSEVVANKIDRLDLLADNLKKAGRRELQNRQQNLERLASHLKLLGPEDILQRGYSLTTGANGEILREADQVRDGDEITTRLVNGQITSVVTPKNT